MRMTRRCTGPGETLSVGSRRMNPPELVDGARFRTEMRKARWLEKRLEKLRATEPATGHALEILTGAWLGCRLRLVALVFLLIRLEPRQRRVIAQELRGVYLAQQLLVSARLRGTQRLPNNLLNEIKNALRVYHVCRQRHDAFVDTILRHDRVRSRTNEASAPPRPLTGE